MMDLSKQAWDAQPWRVLTGGKCFEKTHDGTPFFDWLQAHPKVEHGFHRAMGEIESLGEAIPLLAPQPCMRVSPAVTARQLCAQQQL